MKVSDVLHILSNCDPNMDVAIEQIFREHRSIQLRSIEVINNCIVFKDHYTRVSQYNKFIAFDGTEFTIPPIDERMLPNDIYGFFETK